MAGPLGLQADLDSLKARRALAIALRTREGQDSQYGGIEKFAAALSRGMFGDPMDEFDRKEQALIKQYEDNLTKGYEGVLELEDPLAMKKQAKVIPVPGDGVGPPAMEPGEDFTSADVAKRASAAMAAGVPPELIQKALARRRNEQDMLAAGFGRGGGGGAPSAPQGAAPMGVGAPSAGGASGSAPSVLPYVGGGTQGGGAPAGQPAAPAMQGGSQGEPPVGAENPLVKMFGTGGGLYSELANKTEAQLRMALARADPSSPLSKVLTSELDARKITTGRNGEIIRGNEIIGKYEGGIVTNFKDGSTYDMTGKLLSARKGAEARAEAEAKFPGETIDTVDADGRRKTVFKSQLPGAPYQPQRPAPAPGGKRINLNFSGTAEEVDAYVKQALADQAGGGGGAQQPAIGTGPAPLDVKRQEADISVAAAGRQDSRKAQIENSAKRYESMTTDFNAAQELKPALQAMRALDKGGLISGPVPQAVWEPMVRVANSLGVPVDAKNLARSQTFDSEVSKMVQAIAKNFPGSQSDRELAQLIKSLPARGSTAESRQQIYATLERKLLRLENNYRNASKVYKETGDLVGYEPPAVDDIVDFNTLNRAPQQGR